MASKSDLNIKLQKFEKAVELLKVENETWQQRADELRDSRGACAQALARVSQRLRQSEQAARLAAGVSEIALNRLVTAQRTIGRLQARLRDLRRPWYRRAWLRVRAGFRTANQTAEVAENAEANL